MRRFFLCLATGFLAATARADGPILPPLAGDLAGTFIWTANPAAPPVPWQLSVRPAENGRRSAELTVEVAGGRLRVEAEFDPANGDGRWRLPEIRLDVGAVAALLGVLPGSGLGDLRAEGVLAISGEGALRAGQPSGRLKLEWRDGAVRHAAQGWSLEGVALQGEFTFDAAQRTWASASPAVLTVRTITTGRFGARNLLLHLRLDERLIPAIEVARVEIAGGEIEAAPFNVPLSPLAVNAKLQLRRIGLQDVVALVQAGVSEARGRVDGDLQLGWSKALGIQIGEGRLDLRPDEPMILRLTPAPGLLSASMPEKFALLPAWMGPLSRWFSPVNPGFADLVAIELGRAALRVESLEVRLTPAGDERGRSAHVLVHARPELAGTAVGPVAFEVDVTGPLAYVLRVGIENGTTLKIR